MKGLIEDSRVYTGGGFVETEGKDSVPKEETKTKSAWNDMTAAQDKKVQNGKIKNKNVPKDFEKDLVSELEERHEVQERKGNWLLEAAATTKKCSSKNKKKRNQRSTAKKEKVECKTKKIDSYFKKQVPQSGIPPPVPKKLRLVRLGRLG